MLESLFYISNDCELVTTFKFTFATYWLHIFIRSNAVSKENILEKICSVVSNLDHETKNIEGSILNNIEFLKRESPKETTFQFLVNTFLSRIGQTTISMNILEQKNMTPIISGINCEEDTFTGIGKSFLDGRSKSEAEDDFFSYSRATYRLKNGMNLIIGEIGEKYLYFVVAETDLIPSGLLIAALEEFEERASMV